MRRAVTVLALLLVLSCKDDPVINASIEGKWQGTLAEIEVKPLGLPIPISRDYPSFNTEMEFFPDGTVVLLEGADSTPGTYSVNGDELSVDTDYSIEDVNLSGDYDIERLTSTTLVLSLKRRRQRISDPDSDLTIRGRVKITLHFKRM